MKLENCVYTLKPSDVYRDEIVIPDGYMLTGEFRPPKKGEIFLNKEGAAYESLYNFISSDPRLLLKIKPELVQFKLYTDPKDIDPSYNAIQIYIDDVCYYINVNEWTLVSRS